MYWQEVKSSESSGGKRTQTWPSVYCSGLSNCYLVLQVLCVSSVKVPLLTWCHERRTAKKEIKGFVQVPDPQRLMCESAIKLNILTATLGLQNCMKKTHWDSSGDSLARTVRDHLIRHPVPPLSGLAKPVQLMDLQETSIYHCCESAGFLYPFAYILFQTKSHIYYSSTTISCTRKMLKKKKPKNNVLHFQHYCNTN